MSKFIRKVCLNCLNSDYFALKEPIQVEVEEEKGGWWVARWKAASLEGYSRFGIPGALHALAWAIGDAYEDLRERGDKERFVSYVKDLWELLQKSIVETGVEDE